MTEKGSIGVRINGQDREIPPNLSVFGLLEWLDLNPALIVVELNREILDRDLYGETVVVVKDSSGVGPLCWGRIGSDPKSGSGTTDESWDGAWVMDTPFRIAEREFSSRLIVGTGKYKNQLDHGGGHPGHGRRNGHGGGPAD